MKRATLVLLALSLAGCTLGFQKPLCGDCPLGDLAFPPPVPGEETSPDKAACLAMRDQILRFNGPALDGASRELLVGACWPWMISLPSPQPPLPAAPAAAGEKGGEG
jgi:hypothetical protein